MEQKLRTIVFQTLTESFSALTIKRRAEIILRASFSILITIIICFPEIVIYLAKMWRGFLFVAPVTYCIISRWSDIRIFGKKITVGTFKNTSEQATISDIILGLPTVTIKSLGEFGIPFQKANEILKELTDAGILKKDPAQGNARVLREGATSADIDRALSGEVTINSYPASEQCFTIKQIA